MAYEGIVDQGLEDYSDAEKCYFYSFGNMICFFDQRAKLGKCCDVCNSDAVAACDEYDQL